MDLVQLHLGLADATRLRLLHLLLHGPLCVCHFQAALGEPQVKISKHLGYLRARGLVVSRRQGNWMIYSLPPEAARPRRLTLQLDALQECAGEDPVFGRDLRRLRRLDLTCAPVAAVRGTGRCCG